MLKPRMMLLILLLVLLLIGTQGCKTTPEAPGPEELEIILPEDIVRPQLTDVTDLTTALIQIAELQTYARELEEWSDDVKKIIEEVNGNNSR